MLLVLNLKAPRYAREVYGLQAHLGERFAQVNPEALVEAEALLTRSTGPPSGRKACGQQGALHSSPPPYPRGSL
jgi:hypothetical protein